MGGEEAETPAAEPAPVAQEAPPAEPAETAPSAEAERLEAIVRRWSRELNAGRNAAAAALFAPDALIIQGNLAYQLRTRAEATYWNSQLPCSGEVIDVSVQGDVVTAIFVLGDRTTSQCDAQPGTRAAAEFTIQNGKITAWRQIPVPESDATEA